MEGNPNRRQVGGGHYGGGDWQHWDWAVANNLAYLPGTITKYVCRWRAKNGMQDLEKASHYLDKLISVHRYGVVLPAVPRPPVLGLAKLASVYSLTPRELAVCAGLVAYHTLAELIAVQRDLDTIMAQGVTNRGPSAESMLR
jgi:hypothetical protein